MAWVPIAMAAASMVMQSNAQQQQGQQQAAASGYNAEVERIAAQTQLDQAQAQAQIDQQNTTRRLGQMAADFGGAGVQIGQGSPLEVMRDQAIQGELTRQLTLYRGNVAATDSLNRANLDLFGGSQYAQAGQNASTGTLLTGGYRLGQSLSAGGSTAPPALNPLYVGGYSNAGATTNAPSAAFLTY